LFFRDRFVIFIDDTASIASSLENSMGVSKCLMGLIASVVLATGLVGAEEAYLESASHFESGELRVNLLEMYSSQGCSSCPPAERWLNQFTADPDLWKRFIPVVFHVDYWDDIGWKDPF
jgi:hypothetical protein